MKPKFVLSYSEDELKEMISTLPETISIEKEIIDGNQHISLEALLPMLTLFTHVHIETSINKYHDWLMSKYNLVPKK